MRSTVAESSYRARKPSCISYWQGRWPVLGIARSSITVTESHRIVDSVLFRLCTSCLFYWAVPRRTNAAAQISLVSPARLKFHWSCPTRGVCWDLISYYHICLTTVATAENAVNFDAVFDWRVCTITFQDYINRAHTWELFIQATVDGWSATLPSSRKHLVNSC